MDNTVTGTAAAAAGIVCAVCGARVAEAEAGFVAITRDGIEFEYLAPMAVSRVFDYPNACCDGPARVA